MRMKRILALLLAVAALCGMLVLPSGAASTPNSAFTDINDSEVAEAAETLRLLNIVSGTGGAAFQPDRSLTRAEFCKMAVELMGSGNKVAAQMNRTIFKDVPSTHWARGYIAVATQASTTGSGENASTTPGIIRGDAYGNFNPDRPITYAEAVTILVRILGYGDGDVGMVWPTGYLAKADELELTDGVKLSPNDPLTRGQTALLMENLLYIDMKDGKQYLTSLDCTISEETIIFSVDATTPDGSSGVKVSKSEVYKTSHVPFSDDLVGRRAKLVLDKDKKIIAVQPSKEGVHSVVSILGLNYDSIKVSGDKIIKIDEPKNTIVWKDGDQTTYEEVYLAGLTAGTQAVFQYSAGGELEYIFLRDSVKTDSATRVVKNNPNYTSEAAYPVYKNGVLASVKDIRQYDVTTFDDVNNVMYVSDLRITGIYENVYPNRETPATITVMGHEFPVLSSAASDLASFQVGSSVTLLLSYNGQVAGAVNPSVVKSTTVGTVKSISESGQAVISTLNLIDASGKPIELTGAYGSSRPETMLGQLVRVSSSSKGRLTLTKLSGNGSKAPLNVAERTMGDVVLADNVKLFEQVGNSPLKEIEYEDITSQTVPTDQIAYVRTNYAGKADIVVFNDATGSCYQYGFLDTSTVTISEGATRQAVSVRNGKYPNGSAALVTTDELRPTSGMAGGIAEGSFHYGEHAGLAGYVALNSTSVSSSAFDVDAMTVTTPSMIIPIADNVQCYNEATGSWFAVGENPKDEDYIKALNLARAFSDRVTIYYDKSPDEGGKVRIVVVG